MNENLERYREYGKKFEEFLRPATFPIAIKLIKNEDEIPPNSKSPKENLKIQNFLCQNFSMARRYGWTIAVREEDCVCRLARSVYGWDDINKDMVEFGHKFNIGLYAKDLETSKKLQKHIYMFNNEYIGLVISPLTRTKVKPDVVQIYCLPAQAMRLTQAYLYMEGGMLEFKDAGRIGSCHIGVIKTFQTDKPQLVILGNGDRVWGGAEDYEVMYSIPRSKLGTIIEGLEATHRAGLRYPIPKYMNYKPGFQERFRKRAKKRAGGTLIKE
ncbi:MAG: DUF169 domain-containing protein [Promethearchaeota archaeon]